MPWNRKNYPPEWETVRKRILARSQNRCERCAVPNHAWGWRDHLGKFHEVNKRLLQESGCGSPPFRLACTWENGEVGEIKVIKIVLTIAHIDNHDPQDIREENLAALCQKCHLSHDQRHHARNASVTRWRKKSAGQLTLFT